MNTTKPKITNKIKMKNKNFWTKMKKPFFVMAPMANVTDAAFRKMFAKYGKPDVTWTEFVSADGLASAGKKRLLIDLQFSRKEKPIVAQLFTGHPQQMKVAAKIAAKLGFDGIDINMGCPDRAVMKQGGGAALIQNTKNARAVLEAARAGAPGLPISVKTRIGFNKIEIQEWIGFLLSLELPALTVHLRTKKELSEVPAHWEVMNEIVALRDKISPSTLIIGNGDVLTLADATQKIAEKGCDGVMIGRGLFGNPWLFSGRLLSDITPAERLKVMLEHTKTFVKLLGKHKNFAIMKKHFKAYVSGWDGAKELRANLMEAESVKEVEKVVKEYLKLYTPSLHLKYCE
jgi:nifR3 family TIM-barrel protein